VHVNMTSLAIAKECFPTLREESLRKISEQLQRHAEILEFAITGRVPAGKKAKDFKKVMSRRYKLIDGILYHVDKDKEVMLFSTFQEVGFVFTSISWFQVQG